MGNNAWKERHKRLGLCVDCSEKAVKGNIRCEKHHNNTWRAITILREKWRRIGRCIACGRPLDSDADRNKKSCICCREGILKNKHLCGF